MTVNIFIGQIVHSLSIDKLEIFSKGFLAVSNGKIVKIAHENELDAWKSTQTEIVHETRLTPSQFLLPGFIDCHIHAPQLPNVGLGLDKSLLDWLNTYTFKMEAEYENEKFALEVYEKVVKRTLAGGTTLAAYFGTNHRNGTFILAKEALRQGQRAFVGKTSSNCCSPDYYIETTQNSLQDNIDFINDVLSLNDNLVQPIITPRFAISCDMELQQGLAKIAKRFDLHIQTHISESIGEIEAVTATYNKLYAKVYDEAGLLTNKCILAHGVHLRDEELKLLQERGTSIAHCPTSNTNLSSGLCDVRRILNANVKVGLGTDVSGGDKTSILGVIKDTLTVSHHLDFIKKQFIYGSGKLEETEDNKKYVPFNYKEAIYLATLGGAEALAVDTVVGNFKIGKDFDALIIDSSVNPIDNYNVPYKFVESKFDDDKVLQLLEKFIYVGDDRNIVNVYVRGKQVKL